MNSLTIKKDKYIDADFIRFLIRRIRNLYIANIDDKKLVGWDAYINSYKPFTSKFKKHLSAKEILIVGVSNIIYNEFFDKFVIEIDANIKFPNFPMRVKQAFNLIEFGTVDKPGYRLFSDVLENVYKNIDKYKDMYMYHADK